MTQPVFVVPRAVVDSLVDDFLARGRPVCSSFQPDALRDALRALLGDVVVSYQQASDVLTRFECHKMTGHCNSWTPWMRHRLRVTKIAS